MTRDEWLDAFAAAVGAAPLDEAQADAILELAGIAAHSSERSAAPLTAWIAARAGISAREALAVAHTLEAGAAS